MRGIFGRKKKEREEKVTVSKDLAKSEEAILKLTGALEAALDTQRCSARLLGIQVGDLRSYMGSMRNSLTNFREKLVGATEEKIDEVREAGKAIEEDVEQLSRRSSDSSKNLSCTGD